MTRNKKKYEKLIHFHHRSKSTQIDVKAAIYPPFDPDMDPESIDDKWSLNHRALTNIMYFLTSHRTKIWYMEKHETLFETHILFCEMYNPIKQYFDKYLDIPIPTTYMECKFKMRYREYMHWELAYIITDLELSCLYVLHTNILICWPKFKIKLKTV